MSGSIRMSVGVDMNLDANGIRKFGMNGNIDTMPRRMKMEPIESLRVVQVGNRITPDRKE
jgi:hypothetical protein